MKSKFNPLINSSGTNKSSNNRIKPSIYEAFRDIGREVSGQGKKALGIGNDMANNFFGHYPDRTGGEKSLDWQKETPFIRRKPAYKERYTFEYTVYSRREEIENKLIKEEIEQIRIELQATIKVLGQLGGDIKEAEKAIVQMPQNPGKYHLTFFQKLKSIIRLFRLKIQESSHWLVLMQSKKKQRSYWRMYKKHGTTFGLSNERILATQTG